jgi:hypothetical protein
MRYKYFRKGCGEKEMARAQIEITFREGGAAGVVPQFEPNQILQGSVQVTPDSDLNCKHIYARLKWHTEGRGDRDDGTAGELDLYQGMLRADTPTYHTFHFTLPDSPWSYAGRYVSIIWELDVSLDVPWQIDPKGSTPFIMAPRKAA